MVKEPGCQLQLLCKTWKSVTNSENLARRLNGLKHVPGSHPWKSPAGQDTEPSGYYPEQLASRLVRVAVTEQHMSLQEMYAVCRAEQGSCGDTGANSPAGILDNGFAQYYGGAHLQICCLSAWELDPGNDEDLTVKEMSEINSYIKLVHANLGHPNNKALAQMLKVRGCRPAVLNTVRQFKCDICESLKMPRPRPVASHRPIPQPGREVVFDELE